VNEGSEMSVHQNLARDPDVMRPVNLKKLLSRKDTKDVVSGVIEACGSPVCILDLSNNVISGPENDSLPFRFPIELQNDVIGWVTGGHAAQSIATLISHLAFMEFERKSLAHETLGEYKEIALLYSFSEKVALCHSIAEIAELAINELKKMVRADTITIVLYHGPDRGCELIGAASSVSESYDDRASICCFECIERGGAGEIVNEVSSDSRFAPLGDTVSSLMFTPLKVGARVIGMITVQSGEPLTYSARALKLLSAIASGVSIGLENVLYFEKLIRATAEKEQIRSELKIAHDIQMSMVPRKFPPFPDKGALHIYAVLQPAMEVGGDFYNFFFIDRRHLCFVIGDVSGKGVPAALLMAKTITLIKVAAFESRRTDEILKSVNVEFNADNDQCMFVTIFCGILDIETGLVSYSNGGHNPPFILRHDGRTETLEGAHGPPVGFDDDTEFERAEITLHPYDSILTYTDGVTEARNRENQLFSSARLHELISARSMTSPEDMINELLRAVESFASGMPQADDITIQVVQFCGRQN
jgi:serine phosphatase RsbU (regulator of sigma subunit)